MVKQNNKSPSTSELDELINNMETENENSFSETKLSKVLKK